MKRILLRGVSIAALMLMATPVLAQAARGDGADLETTTLEEVVVTARALVATPVELLKERSRAIVDSITLEGIEKSADISLPEALERVVGVSATGFYGTSEPGYVDLRGFDSRYNSLEIDGNPILFSSQNNRGAQSGMFPSAIVKEANVYKTVTPDLDANSIGGHIAMRTLRAFDGGTQPYFKIGTRVGSSENESTISDGPSYQVYSAGKFTFGADRRFGLVFGFNQQRTSDYDDFGSVGGYTQAPGPDGVVHDQIGSNVFTDSHYDKTVRNTAVFAKLEARQEDMFYAFLSGNIFDEQRDMYLQRSGAYIADGGSRTVTQTGPGQADFTGGQGQVREYDYDMQRKAKVVGLGVDYRLMDKGSMSFRANYTDYSNDTLTRNLGGGFRLNGVDGSYDINGDVPVIRPFDAETYNDPSNWAFQNSGSGAYNRTQPLRDDIYTLGAILNYNNQASAEGFGASGGVSWVRLDRSFDQNFLYYSLLDDVTLDLAQVTPAGATMLANQAALSDYDVFWDFMHDPGNASVSEDDSATADYELLEDVLAFHGTAYYSNGGLRVLAGVRNERTRDTTDTSQLVSGVIQPQHRSSTYDNWMPNVQASYYATARLKLRAAFTKTIGRPDFSDFAPGTTTTFDANGVTVVRGSNADLGPRVSTNYDASIEYYLDEGLLALAVFQKDIADETFNQRTEIVDSSGMLTEIHTIPLNTGSASMKGFEITAAKRRLDFLPSPFDRFGFSANYTRLDGQWDVVFTDGTTRSVGGLRGQPEWMANLRVSYDAGPVDLHLSYRKLGRAFTGNFGTTALNDIWVRPNDRLDLRANLTLWKQFRLTFDAKNITDTYRIQSTGLEDSQYNSLGWGRSYWVGLRYSSY